MGFKLISFSDLSLISRKKKLELFYSLFKLDKNTTILDVGGEIDPQGNSTLQLIDSYPWKKNITVINSFEPHIQKIRHFYPEINSLTGDACKLPWPDKSFDIVYCNAVIEHVGNEQQQKQMAQEIMRIAKCWFVTTPNRWFPYEFHLRLPIVTWLPRKLLLKAGWLYSYNHVNKKYVHGLKIESLRLLSARDMHKLFPDSKIIKQRITILPETLIAISK